MKEIALTQGKVVVVDDADYEWLNQWKWHAHRNRHTFYAQRFEGPRLNQQQVLMHALLLEVPKGFETDHKDGNGLNNQRANLRVSTRAQNQYNQRSRKGCSSAFKGVSWHKECSKWGVQIQVNGKRQWLGLFEEENEAALIYKRVAIRCFGEFACLNR